MDFKLFSAPSSSSTQKGLPEGDFDENGVNLKLSLEPPSSIDLKLSLNPTPVKVKVKKCHVCQCMETPIWRTGPKGTRTLCNACGLKYRKFDQRRKACLAEGIPMWYSRAIDREFANLVGEIYRGET